MWLHVEASRAKVKKGRSLSRYKNPPSYIKFFQLNPTTWFQYSIKLGETLDLNNAMFDEFDVAGVK